MPRSLLPTHVRPRFPPHDTNNQWLATAMDTDKIKVFGARLKVDGTGKLAELERAERVSIRFHSLRIT
jgi:hypothetical protein